MGNAEATVSAGNKAQANKDACEWFQFVDLHGGGEFVDLMKAANLSRDYRDLDEAIQKKVLPYMYNGGKGKHVSSRELVYARHCYKLGKELRPNDFLFSSRHAFRANSVAAASDLFRLENGRAKVAPERPPSSDDDGGGGNASADEVLVCWDLYKRGPVGETMLHLCLLQVTPVHADLAKRLLHNFPNLLVDTYISDQYYGETALHMAIVNEDPPMVKALLGLDRWRLHGRRCCGEFFCAEDQKRSRRDAERGDLIVVPVETDYSGYVYWGEYPLSFAACLGQEECVRLLVARGADLNAQDFNGNTALHMAVVRNRKDMFELLRSLGAALGLKNRQGLTPLTLAAKLARKDVYDYILEKEREVFWIFGDVMCAAYPLADVDSIGDCGQINTKSVLDLIVHGSEEQHLDMVEGLVVHLLHEKWRTFVRFRFYRRLFFFFCYFVVFAVAMGLRETQPHDSYGGAANSSSSSSQSNITDCYSTYALSYDGETGMARAALDATVLLCSVIYLALACKEIYHQGWRVFTATLRYAPAKTLFLCSCASVVLMAPARLSCQCVYDDVFATLAMLCTAPYFLFFLRGFKIVGPFVVMIYKMILGDFVRFLSVYILFILGFSQALYIVFMGYAKSHPDEATPFTDPVGAAMAVFYMSTGQFGSIHESLSDTRHPVIGAIAFAVYMIIVTILLINMFIAMMGNTYKLVNESQKEWLRQWANIVLVVEQSITPGERLRQRRNYSQPLGDGVDGRRALVIRERQTAEDMLAMKEERVRQHAQQLDKILKHRKLLRKQAEAKT